MASLPADRSMRCESGDSHAPTLSAPPRRPHSSVARAGLEANEELGPRAEGSAVARLDAGQSLFLDGVKTVGCMLRADRSSPAGREPRPSCEALIRIPQDLSVDSPVL
jgi:hypothetical protein